MIVTHLPCESLTDNLVSIASIADDSLAGRLLVHMHECDGTGLPGEAKSVKRFERSNGLDTALYKNYLYLYELNILWAR